MRYIAYLALFLFHLFLESLPAQASSSINLENATVFLKSSVKTIQLGKPFWILFQIDLSPGWHTYWLNPGTSGLPTQIDWVLPSGFSASAIRWQVPQIITHGETINYGYNDRAYHLVQITPSTQAQTGTSVKLAAKASWLICKDSCMPQSTDLSITLPVSKIEEISNEAEEISKLVESLPKPLTLKLTYQKTKTDLTLRIPSNGLPKPVKGHFFPEQKGIILGEKSQELTLNPEYFSLKIKRDLVDPEDSLTGILQFLDKDGKETAFDVVVVKDVVAATDQEEWDIWEILLFAFLGGLILNAMPCVFPILSLKALSVSRKRDKNRSFVIQQGFAYTAGVIISFSAMAAILVFLRKTGVAIGWGFQMQSPLFVGFMAYLMFLIGLSLSGYFYVPSLFGSTMGMEEEQSTKDSFLVGVLAVLVATPCTAPLMGVAIGYALSQPGNIIFSVFLMLGFGFALPYLLISISPTLLKCLPKPGAWMETLKEFLAFPMYATVVWLVWILLQQSGSFSVLLIGFGLVMVAFSCWLWQHLQLKNTLRKTIAFLILALLCYIPLHHLPTDHSFAKDKKVSSFTTAKLESLIAAGKPVFVNATASWCITCKINEAVLKKASVRRFFKKKGIAYLEADWTNRNSEITSFLERFGRHGVPLYVFYSAKGSPKILPQVLTESVIQEHVNIPD